MPAYANLSGNSGVTWYDLGDDWIEVRFRKGTRTYRYTAQLNGQQTIDDMKAMAQAGRGLSTFIAQNRPAFV